VIVDAYEVDPDDVDELAPDRTIGMLYQRRGEEFPEGTLFDLNRVQAAIAEYRNEFDDDYANIGLYQNEETGPHLAFWSDSDCSRAIVVVPRIRAEESDVE